MSARPDPFTRSRQEWLERVQDHPKLGNSHLALAFAIGRHLNRSTGDAWPSQTTLAGVIGVSARQVRTLLRDLENEGLLTTKSGGFQRPDRYQPSAPERKLTSALNVEADFRSVAPAERKLTSAQSGSGLPPNPLNEPFEDSPPLSPPVGGGMLELVPEEPSIDEAKLAFDLWNVMARANGLPIAKLLDGGRRRAIRKRLEEGGLDAWAKAVDAVSRSKHCRGENDRGWRADIDFVCQPRSWRRLLEGFYGESPRPTISGGAGVRPSLFRNALEKVR